MTKAKRYDTVILTEPIGSFAKGGKGAVVEVYTTPYEAYDLEFVDEDGRTKGLLEAVRPEQLEVLVPAETGVRFATIRLEAGGTAPATPAARTSSASWIKCPATSRSKAPR